MKISVILDEIAVMADSSGFDPISNVVKQEWLIHGPNPYSTAALEEAIRLREKYPDIQVSAYSLGGADAARVLTYAMAMGADDAFWIPAENIKFMDLWDRAFRLANAIQSRGNDLILCGRLSADENTEELGPFIADIIGVPFISDATKIDMVFAEQKGLVWRRLERGDRDVYEAKLPLLITVERGIRSPRYVSVRKQSLPWRITKIEESSSNKSSDLNVSPVTLIGSALPRPKPKKGAQIATALSAQDRLMMLMSGGSSQKKEGGLVEGKPGEVARRISEFFEEKGFY